MLRWLVAISAVATAALVVLTYRKKPEKRTKRKQPIYYAGLYNLGNTCYLNAVLQALSMLTPIHNTLRIQSSPILLRLLAFLQDLSTPYPSRTILSTAYVFENAPLSTDQQDAEEFLRAIFQLVSAKTATNKNESVIRDLQVWEQVEGSSIACIECGNQSGIALSVSDMIIVVNIKPTIEECIKQIPESIADYRCESCNGTGSAFQSKIIFQIPLVYIIHIQRLQMKQNQLIKSNQHVSFEQVLFVQKTRFKLMAVVEHLGGPNGGHYITFKRTPYGWLFTSDTETNFVNWTRVQSCQATLIFYQIENEK